MHLSDAKSETNIPWVGILLHPVRSLFVPGSPLFCVYDGDVVTVGWGCVLFTLTAMADGIGARVAVDVARAQTQLCSAASRSSTTSALTC